MGWDSAGTTIDTTRHGFFACAYRYIDAEAFSAFLTGGHGDFYTTHLGLFIVKRLDDAIRRYFRVIAGDIYPYPQRVIIGVFLA